MSILINLIISSIAVFAAAYILPGVSVDNFTAAMIAAIVIGVFNAFLKPILLILTLPITIVTLGLFALVINALLILLADQIVPGFSVEGFVWALILSVVLSVINFFLHNLSRT
jgi:putative membrane protein